MLVFIISAGAQLASGGSNGFNLDQIAEVQARYGDDGSGRAPVAEEIGIDAVEGVPMVDADEVSGDVEDAGRWVLPETVAARARAKQLRAALERASSNATSKPDTREGASA